MSTHQKRAGRKPVKDTLGCSRSLSAQLSKALVRLGDAPLSQRAQITAHFRRSKYFQGKEQGGK